MQLIRLWLQVKRGTLLQAKEEETTAQIAVLAAELKQMRWEKSMIEQQAETLKTALAVCTGPPSEVCFLAKQVWLLHVVCALAVSIRCPGFEPWPV